MARPSYRETPPSDRILSLMTADGSRVPLAELRTSTLKKLHMSPSTLSKELKSLEATRLVNRIVDTSTRPPRVYYERRLKTQPGRIDFEEWFRPMLQAIEEAILDSLSRIHAKPQMKLEELEDERMTVEFLVSRVSWIILADFQKLVRSKQMTGTNRVVAAHGEDNIVRCFRDVK